MSQHAQYDPYAGQQQYAPPAPPAKSRKWPWILGIVVAFLVGTGVGGAGDRSTPTPAASSPQLAPALAEQEPAVEQAPAREVGTIPDGEWLVPSEVTPGRYRSTGPDEGFIEYCQVTTEDKNGDILEWKNAGRAGSQIIVTVSEKAATVKNSGCGTFTKVD